MSGDLQGRRCVITGGARGMGRVTAEALAERGVRVVLLDWQGEEGSRVRDAICRRHGEGAAEFHYCDLSSLAQVRKVAAQLVADARPVDVLLCNAGITYPEYRESEEGHEFHLATCHLAHYLLCRLLLPSLERSDAGRIVLVSSEGHRACEGIDFGDLNGRRFWNGATVSHGAGFRAYAQAKLCNILTMRALHRRLAAAGSRVTVNAVSPGYFVNTGIHREMRGLFRLGALLVFGLCSVLRISTPAKGARVHIEACAAPELTGQGGKYRALGRELTPSKLALDEALAERLWTYSAGLVGLPEAL